MENSGILSELPEAPVVVVVISCLLSNAAFSLIRSTSVSRNLFYYADLLESCESIRLRTSATGFVDDVNKRNGQRNMGHSAPVDSRSSSVLPLLARLFCPDSVGSALFFVRRRPCVGIVIRTVKRSIRCLRTHLEQAKFAGYFGINRRYSRSGLDRKSSQFEPTCLPSIAC